MKTVAELKNLQSGIVKKSKKFKTISGIALAVIFTTSIIIPALAGADFFIIVPGLFFEFIFSLVICVIVHQIILGKDLEKFKTSYKKIFVKTALNRIFDDVEYSSQKGITRLQIQSTNMMTTGDDFSSNDYISAKYHGLPFVQSDIHIQNEHKDDDGNSHWVTVFKGRWMIFDFNKKFISDIQIVNSGFHGNMLGGERHKYRKIALEDPEFNKMFAVYSGDGLDVFYALPPDIMERMKNLSKTLNCGLMFCFIDKKLHIAINNSEDSFECDVFKEIDEAKIEAEISRDIKLITEFVEQLRLDKGLFNKNK